MPKWYIDIETLKADAHQARLAESKKSGNPSRSKSSPEWAKSHRQ
jgi:hypothetical protein